MSSVSRCGACGAFVKPEDRFCWSCGSQLGVLAPSPQPTRIQPARQPDSEAELAIRRAYLAQQRGQLEEAEALLRGVLARDPNNIPALSILSEVLRAKDDLIGAVAAAQRASDAASEGTEAPGALARARTERAQIQEAVIRELSRISPAGERSLVGLFLGPRRRWHQSGRCYCLLALLGLAALFLALVAALRGELLGYLWFGVGLLGAGWSYYDAETHGESGLFWGPLVLCLGVFGLAIYLLSRY